MNQLVLGISLSFILPTHLPTLSFSLSLRGSQKCFPAIARVYPMGQASTIR